MATICPHNPTERLSYMAWHADADRRDKAGQKQVMCPDCAIWQWPDQLCDRGKWAVNNPDTAKHMGGNHYMTIPGERYPGAPPSGRRGEGVDDGSV